MTKKLTDSSFYYRLGEIIIPLTTWFVILMPVWLSPFHPAIVAYFIIMFDIYFLYKSITTTYLATRSYREVQVHNAIPYASKISEEPKIQGIHQEFRQFRGNSEAILRKFWGNFGEISKCTLFTILVCK